MQSTIEFVAIAMYAAVGLVSLAMARKCLTANRPLAFHQAATGVPLEQLADGTRQVMSALTRTTGLGFLVVGLLLLVFPASGEFAGSAAANPVVRSGLPVLCAGYCAGLAAVNHRLHRQSGVATPWQGSLAAAGVVIIAVALDAVSQFVLR